MPIVPLVRVAARFFADLATRRRTSRPELEAQVRSITRAPAAQVQAIVTALVDATARLSLVSERGDALNAYEMTAQNRLGQELERVIAGAPSSETLDALRGRIPRDYAVLVRCARLKDLWNIVLTTQFAEYADARTIEPHDIQTSAIPRPAHKLALVYDNLTLLRKDLEDDDAELAALREQAQVCICLGSQHAAALPARWSAVPVAGAN